MRLVWSTESAEDLAALRAFIAADSPSAAKRVVRRIAETVETLLRQNPEIGRRGRAPGTRELVISQTPFLVAYRVHNETIEVLRVLHGAQRWPDRL
ncbi:MAG TPA: type II toxin-antitoxin system RelE/ParE family toxin [Roseiarcus sp.]